MNFEITKYDKDNTDIKSYKNSRNILNIYNHDDLNKIHKIDLYMMMDLDMYRTKDIPPKILKHVSKLKKRQYHPDVSRGPRQAYILVDIATEILGDKWLRSIYDSSYFDVNVPEDKIYFEEEFFTIFQKCFDEYARFSVQQPVVKLKDDGFYEFWNKYKSNRIYIPIDEFYHLSSADRLEYSKIHQDKLNKMKNEDILKLKELLRICKKRDPRIKSISEQLDELRLEKINQWTEDEIKTLKKFLSLFGKTKKNKWEIITEKLVGVTKKKRTVKDVMKKAEEISKK